MIICPRCGYQAPDGSPWCPRCGYGCPYPVPYRQPVVYQPPARYDVYDLPPRPNQPPQPEKPKKRKKKKLPKFLRIILISLGVMLASFIVLIIAAILSPSDTSSSTKTPTLSRDELMGTAVAQAQRYQDETLTVVALSATPTFTEVPPTFTPLPTYTPFPTYTPYPTDTPVPVVAAPQGYTDSSYGITGSGWRGSVSDTTASTCTVKGSNNGIYHCQNSPNYSTMKNYVCFSSQSDAEAAGYRMSGNQGGWCQQ